MAHKVRSARLTDLLGLALNSRRQRVLRLNPPYTLIDGERALGGLLKSSFSIAPQTSCTYLCVDRKSVLGYVQAQRKSNKADEWLIAALGTIERAPDCCWEVLLEEVCRAAGERGVTRISVKVPRDDPRLELFRRLGFTNYTTEYIWGNLFFTPTSAHIDKPSGKPMRRQTNQDAWNVMQLYSSVTPLAVQAAEGLTSRSWHVGNIPQPFFFSPQVTEKSYLWPDENGDNTALGGYVKLLTGPRGHWITLIFRPDLANRSLCPAAIDYVLWKAAHRINKPVYCGVREYQTELEGLLETKGFHLLSEQALLVKYLAEPVKAHQPALAPFLVAKRGEMVATEQ
ncbi:MAG: hypothetical protein IVW55_15035 [Chloroflexi bacterium]|nr:hypothetical protein [Chloroflexota bacterium]